MKKVQQTKTKKKHEKCSECWAQGYKDGSERTIRDNDKFLVIGRAIADLVYDLTKEEDY